MRWYLLLLALLFIQPPVHADDETRREVLGVISGLLGQPTQQGSQPQAEQPSAYATYENQREELVKLLQSGEYVTSRTGEPVDFTLLGVPLTHVDKVYRALPVAPARTGTATAPSQAQTSSATSTSTAPAASQPARKMEKRCPVDGQRYPALLDYCPVHGVALEPAS